MKIFQILPIKQQSVLLLRSSSRRPNYSTATSSAQSVSPPKPAASRPPPPRSPPEPSRGFPTALVLIGGVGVGIGAYYYYDPKAEVFRQIRSVVGIGEVEEKPKKKEVEVKGKLGEELRKKSAVPEAKAKVPAPALVEKPKPAAVAVPAPPPPPPPKPAVSLPSPPPPIVPATASSFVAAAAAPLVTNKDGEEVKKQEGEGKKLENSVPKHVLITALRAQQEALSESHEAKVKGIQEEYDRRLGNVTKVIEAERVVELRGKYEKASAALSAIEKGIEARTAQNERAKKLRSLWAQVNALHARVNHPEYHTSPVTKIDKSSLLLSVQDSSDGFVNKMVDSLPTEPVHSLESLKERFYKEVEPVAKSVGLIKDGEGFSVWKYVLGRVFSGGIAEIRGIGVGKKEASQAADATPTDNAQASPVRSTAEALDTAKRALDKSDLLGAAIAVNQLTGLPRQVASDWLTDARTLLETNQTLFVLMTYAASNNVF